MISTPNNGIISTIDDDGNEHHHHVLSYDKTFMPIDLTSVKDNAINTNLKNSAYFQEITFRKSNHEQLLNANVNIITGDSNTIQQDSPQKLSPSKVLDKNKNINTTGKNFQQYALQVSELIDTDTTVELYTKALKTRGTYTVGAHALLENLNSDAKSLHSTSGSPNNEYTKEKDIIKNSKTIRPENPTESYQVTENIFKLAHKEKTTKQGTSKSKLARQKFRDALRKLRKENKLSSGNEQQQLEFVAKRPSYKNTRHQSFYRSPRQIVQNHTQKNLHDHIIDSNTIRRKVMCGQTMKYAEKTIKDTKTDQEEHHIHHDIHLKKRTWSLNKSRKQRSKHRRRNRRASRNSSNELNEHSRRIVHRAFGEKKKSVQGGSFLMLGKSRQLDTRNEGNKDILPEDKLHWKTVEAGPYARAAALQTERLQRIAEALEQNVNVHGLAKIRGAKQVEIQKIKRWKELVSGIRISRNISHGLMKELHEHVLETVERSNNSLNTWQAGFRKLYGTHNNRLRNALTVRDLHRSEMQTNEHMGYIMTQVEKKSGENKKNGSEALIQKHNSKTSQKLLPENEEKKSTTLKMLDNKLDVWKSNHDEIPEVIKTGTLTSFWTETRIERKTKEEIKTLGDGIVKFWHHFCLARASLTGKPAPGELELVGSIKDLLESGKQITEQVVHDMMVMMDKKSGLKHPRIKKLLKMLEKQTNQTEKL
jgi:hypothetical protein